MPEQTPIKIFRLSPTFEAFGLLMDHLAHIEPFSQFESVALADAVHAQLHRGHHLVAMQGDRIVGYAGWLLTSRAIGEAWAAGRGKLTPVADALADAASLTIVTARDKRAIPRLIRGARELNAGRRVYFKRDANSTQTARKRSVLIVSKS